MLTIRSSTSDETITTRSRTSTISSTFNEISSSIGVTVGTTRSSSTLVSTISSTETQTPSLSGFNSTTVSSTLNGTPIGVTAVTSALNSTLSSTLNGTLSTNSTVSSISNVTSTTLIGNGTYNSTNSHIFIGVPTQNNNSSWNISDLFIDEGFEEEASTRVTLKAIVNKDIYPLFNNHSVQTLIHIWFGLIILCCCLGVMALFAIRYHYKKKEREAIANIHRKFAITRVEVVEYNSNGRFKAKNNAPISVPFSDPELW